LTSAKKISEEKFHDIKEKMIEDLYDTITIIQNSEGSKDNDIVEVTTDTKVCCIKITRTIKKNQPTNTNQEKRDEIKVEEKTEPSNFSQ
jgi:hypothetical protein